MNYGFIKVGAYTPKIKVADTDFNAKAVLTGIEEAAKSGVKILCMPELCLTGYTCSDLFYSSVLQLGALNALKTVTEGTKNFDMIITVGLPIKKDSLLYNVAAVIYKGEVLALIPKTYLPNYNEFYEKRHFASYKGENSTVKIFDKEVPFGTKIIIADENLTNLKIAVEICEDLWSVNPPSVSHALNGATIVLNPSCSDETVGKKEYRKELISSHSAKLNLGYVYADAGDGESTTDMVFAGHNLIAENGKILSESQLFSNGLIVSEIDVEYLSYERSKLFNYDYPVDSGYKTVYVKFNKEDASLTRSFPKTPFVPVDETELNGRAELILTMQASALKKRLQHTNAKTAVIGLSGGLDSTLALIVTAKAFDMIGKDRADIITVTMPCFGTTGRTYDNSCKLAKAYKTTLKKVDIKKSVERHFKDIGQDKNTFDVTYENSQARERTQVLMDIANKTGGIVIGTGDLSELALGFATYNGDHMSMYGVNSSVPKTLVRHLVKYTSSVSNLKLKHVLDEILATPVSPELLPAENGNISQKTEEIVGPYILHDFYLYYMLRFGYSPKKIYRIAEKTFDGDFKKETIKKWLSMFMRRFFNQQFKRSCVPDGVKIGSVALSPRGDWRMPSDAVSALWLNEVEEL